MARGKPEKQRLDTLLVERGLCASREKARARIMAGDVLVDGAPATKAGAQVSADAAVRLKNAECEFVSRGGHKLSAALDAFALDVAGLHALDAGASTGGFTDCLLQRGAASVTALDVGYGQLDLRLRNDPRVTVMERFNARHAAPGDFSRAFDIVTVDVSFISLDKVLPALARLLAPIGALVALVKPQFEAGRERVGKGGVVRDPAVHEQVLESAAHASRQSGLRPLDAAFSPITGPKGNIEFLLLARPEPGFAHVPELPPEKIREVVRQAHQALDA